MDVQAFRGVSGSRVVLDQQPGQQATGTQKATIGFKDRLVNWHHGASFKHGTQAQIQENKNFKAAFLTALKKAEGTSVADRAARKCGLEPGWEATPKAMSARQVAKILDTAQHLRMDAIKTNNKAAQSFLKSGGSPSFAATFGSVGAHHGAPVTDLGNRDLGAKFLREVRRDPTFGQKPLTPGDLGQIAAKTINAFYAERTARFNEQHSGLAQFVQAGHAGTPRPDSRTFMTELAAKLSPGMAQGNPLATEPTPFRLVASDALLAIKENYAVLNKMAYAPVGMAQVRQEVLAQYQRLDNLENALRGLGGNSQPQSQPGQDLHAALLAELTQQKSLLANKADMLMEMQRTDPFSTKMVAHSDLLWANAAGHIIDDLKAALLGPPPVANAQAKVAQLDTAKQNFIQAKTQAYNTASNAVRTPEPSSATTKAEKAALKHNHPVVLGRTAATDFLRTELARIGIPAGELDQLVGKESMGEARRKALDSNQSWAPVDRLMQVNKDGVTRTYHSKITPASQITARLGRLYLNPQQAGGNAPLVDARPGASSGNKADHYHARNLKLSELERVLPNGQTQTMAKVVGHGVLDMWDIEDPGERQAANSRGAKEVLETAVATNDRVTQTALNRIANGDNTPVKVTHVSVNLITPSTPRDKLIQLTDRAVMPHHMEGAYTDNQFRAFAANTTAGNGGQPVTMKVDDTRPGGQLGQDVDINVDVDVISFSFALNPLATGITIKGHEFHFPDAVAGWTRVYEHNRGMMEKFVGDLGTGKFGAQGSRPGGFIGTVYDRLDPNTPAEAELMAKIKEQTDIVRDMFTSQSFKHGNGDPAKMSRHILALQGLAEEALAVANVADQAATMSKGCKSDKDRGGVTDVEFKHMLVSEDMGGEIRPNERLEGEDQDNYYVVAANSGQFENQQLNTGVAGSKEAGKLALRMPDKEVRNYLAGLGKFASE